MDPLRTGVVVFGVGFVVGLVVGHPFPGAFVALGLAVAVNGLRVLPEWRQARGVTEQAIGSVTPGSGAVEVVRRTVRDGETTTAPVTGTECLAYVVDVEEYKYFSGGQHGSSGYRWTTAGRESETVPFFVEDASGTAWVDTAEIEYFLEEDRELELEEEERPPDSLRRVLEASDLDAVCKNERRYTEQRLDEAEEVHVAAEATAPSDRTAPDGRRPTVALTDGPSTPMFSVATDPEMDVGGELLWRAVAGALLGLTLVAVGVAGVEFGIVGGFVAFFAGILVIAAVAAAGGRGEFVPD